jgi:hypothetical protein
MQKLFFYVLALLSSAQLMAQSGAIGVDGLNVLYHCIDNPISVAVAGVPSANIQVEGIGGDIVLTPVSEGVYNAKVSTVAPVQIKLTDKKTGKVYAELPFRVLPIPEPVITAGIKPRAENTGAVDYYRGLWAEVALLDSYISCKVLSFNVDYTRVGQSAIFIKNEGARFNTQTNSAIASAKSGDTYLFTDIKVVCPCDKVSRRVSDLLIRVP